MHFYEKDISWWNKKCEDKKREVRKQLRKWKKEIDLENEYKKRRNIWKKLKNVKERNYVRKKRRKLKMSRKKNKKGERQCQDRKMINRKRKK